MKNRAKKGGAHPRRMDLSNSAMTKIKKTKEPRDIKQ